MVSDQSRFFVLAERRLGQSSPVCHIVNEMIIHTVVQKLQLDLLVNSKSHQQNLIEDSCPRSCLCWKLEIHCVSWLELSAYASSSLFTACRVLFTFHFMRYYDDGPSADRPQLEITSLNDRSVTDKSDRWSFAFTTSRAYRPKGLGIMKDDSKRSGSAGFTGLAWLSYHLPM